MNNMMIEAMPQGFSNGNFTLLFLLLLVTVVGCSSTTDSPGYIMAYQEALARTDPTRMGTVEEGSVEEKAAIERFVDFFTNLSEETVRTKAKDVYGENAYLNDTLNTIYGAEAIEDYFVETVRKTDQFSVQMTDVAHSEGNYYFRWFMTLQFDALNGGKPIRSIGMSHIRFNRQGKVVLHQDYWDSTTGLLQHVPVMGGLLEFMKNRL